jgi:TolB-like protein/DNA-binding SARP family transcriptional activator/Tfp pilus assembly protein PilF
VHVTLKLLGGFAACLSRPGASPLAIAGPRQRALLAHLAMQPDYTDTRERLAALLWGTRTDKLARQNLRQMLLHLRREFAAGGCDALKVDRESAGLDPSVLWVDAREFLELAHSDDPAILGRAADLYAGDFLRGLHLDVGPFDDWVRIERARLNSAAAALFERCALHHDVLGEGPQAITMAERLVALDPLHEESQRLLLRLLARYRGRTAALGHADVLSRLLRTELDAGPEAKTKALIAQIGQSDVAASPAVEAVSLQSGTPSPQKVAASLACPTGLSRPALQTAAIPIEEAPNSGGRAKWLQRRPRVGWRVAAALLIAAAVIMADDHWRPSGSDGRPLGALEAHGEGNQPWRSPNIFPNTGVDKVALAAQGFSAVIVLPFTAKDAPEAGKAARLAERITDDLINDLSRVPPLRVIARQTSRLYGGQRIDVAAIGAELGVRYVVEGSVQFQEPRLRVNVALIEAATRFQVWSDRIEREYSERFSVQDEIARGIARALHVNVLALEDRRRSPAATGDASVNDLLAKGWNAMALTTASGTTGGADAYFEEVLRRDPNNVPALIGLGGHHVLVVERFLEPEPGEHLEKAEELLRRAIGKNPKSVMSYYFMGVLHKARGQWQQALEAFSKALENNPSLPLAYAQVGHVVARMGRFEEGIEHVRYAIRLSPKDPSLGLFSLFGGEIELERGRYDEAVAWLGRSVLLAPLSALGHASFAATLALNDDKTGATRQAAEMAKVAPWLTLERVAQRIASLPDNGAGSPRLIEGLRKASATPAEARLILHACGADPERETQQCSERR